MKPKVTINQLNKFWIFKCRSLIIHLRPKSSLWPNLDCQKKERVNKKFKLYIYIYLFSFIQCVSLSVAPCLRLAGAATTSPQTDTLSVSAGSRSTCQTIQTAGLSAQTLQCSCCCHWVVSLEFTSGRLMWWELCAYLHEDDWKYPGDSHPPAPQTSSRHKSIKSMQRKV